MVSCSNDKAIKQWLLLIRETVSGGLSTAAAQVKKLNEHLGVSMLGRDKTECDLNQYSHAKLCPSLAILILCGLHLRWDFLSYNSALNSIQ